jgi:hypothetical protein
MGYETLNTEHRQEYEEYEKEYEKEEYNTKKGKQKCRDRKRRNIERAIKLKEGTSGERARNRIHTRARNSPIGREFYGSSTKNGERVGGAIVQE